MPYITFLYMYQPMIPQAYQELKAEEEREQEAPAPSSIMGFISNRLRKMDKVLSRSSLLAVFVYCLVGIFGYATFSSSQEQTEAQLWAANRSKDILEADYGPGAGWSLRFCQLLILFAVICSSPLALLPAKQSYFQLVHRSETCDTMTNE